MARSGDGGGATLDDRPAGRRSGGWRGARRGPPPLEAPSMSRAQNLEGVMPVGFVRSENRHYIGKRLPEIAAERGEEWPDTVRPMPPSEEQRIPANFSLMSQDNHRCPPAQPLPNVGYSAGATPSHAVEAPAL